MRPSLWLFVLLFSFTCRMPAQVLFEHTNSQATFLSTIIDEEKKSTVLSSSYSLNEFLERVPEIYLSSLREAITKITLGQNKDTIHFSQLLGGLSKSQLFRVDVNDKKYVLRLLDGTKQIERRQSELQAHIIGAKLKIAPELIYYDQIPLVMVMEFIEGRTFTHDDLNDKETVRKVMRTLKKFRAYHEENRLLKRTKVEAIKESYKRCLKKGVVYPSCFEGFYKQLQEKFNAIKTDLIPSHGDLNPGNILITEDGCIYLIDWAEASIDNPFLDISWLGCFSGANPDQIKGLLREYLEREPQESEIKEAFFFRDVTTFLVATLWIGRQEERDQIKLDSLLNGPLKKSSEYIREGITTSEISMKKGLDLTIYALGWLKEFIDNYEQKPICSHTYLPSHDAS